MKHSEFTVPKLNEVGITWERNIANEFDGMLTTLEHLCEPGRELNIVKTKLEEACFFAKKAMAIKPINQEQKDND